MKKMEHYPVGCTMVKYAVSHTRIGPCTCESLRNSMHGFCVSRSSQSNMAIIVQTKGIYQATVVLQYMMSR